mmetsp:Transcript_72791/g.131123  ORF Transcript_72791/g.131123 Transcript_72791/m.131123 type:complete len:236 (-) Transcript_72791:19-726(-)
MADLARDLAASTGTHPAALAAGAGGIIASLAFHGTRRWRRSRGNGCATTSVPTIVLARFVRAASLQFPTRATRIVFRGGRRQSRGSRGSRGRCDPARVRRLEVDARRVRLLPAENECAIFAVVDRRRREDADHIHALQVLRLPENSNPASVGRRTSQDAIIHGLLQLFNLHREVSAPSNRPALDQTGDLRLFRARRLGGCGTGTIEKPSHEQCEVLGFRHHLSKAVETLYANLKV